MDDWRARNADHLRRLSGSELRLRYTASRVLRHTADLVATMAELDEADVTLALVAYGEALHILKDVLASDDNDDIITTLLDAPRLPTPSLDDRDYYATPSADTASHAQPPLLPADLSDPPSNETWVHTTVDAIEKGIRAYLEPIRWTTKAQHFGAVVNAINDLAIPTLLNDPHAITTELSPDTAVTISLLKTGLVPDHTDNTDDVIAWFEALVLWVENTGYKEIPASIITETAKDYGVTLLTLAPLPSHEATGEAP